VTEGGEWLSKGEDNIPKLGVGFLYPLTAPYVLERNTTAHTPSASVLLHDSKDSTEALFDSIHTPIFARPTVVIHHVICVGSV
jgi:hypothetical protein